MVIVGNGSAGLWALAAHQVPRLRHRALWWFTVAAELTVFVQAGLGVGLVAGQDLDPPRLHDFYGYVAIATVGIAYSYRGTSPWVREHRELFYAGTSLFIMGLAIRALTLS
ncbi:hypothetical protein BH20ACT2_BH20ACT2_15980 [soil metagenome]